MVIPEFLTKDFDDNTHWCTAIWPKEWMSKAFSLTWFLVMALFPVSLMVVLYSRIIYELWYKREESDGINDQQQVRSINQSIHPSIHPSINQSINELINQSINQSY